MVNKEHLKLLDQGLEVWNEWRKQNRQIQARLEHADLRNTNLRGANLSSANLGDAYLINADLSGADLSKAHLSMADLSGTNLSNTDLSKAKLRGANLTGANLEGANLWHVNLRGANLSSTNLGSATLINADLSDANLSDANLIGANLSEANLSGANLSGANLSVANLSGANLSGADLMYVNFIWTNCEKANFTNCKIYGISAWNLELQGAVQSDLIITQDDEPIITVDNLEVAQFIYLLLHNEKIRDVIDTISRKVVLILGRFGEHKAVLDAIRNELRKHDYLPVLFDFEKPTNRDLTETVRTLAHLSRFIIADITEPRSIPQELQAIVPHLAVPVQPLILEGSTGEYAMFQDLSKYRWMLPIHPYKDIDYLLDSLGEKVIVPAEAKAQELEKR